MALDANQNCTGSACDYKDGAATLMRSSAHLPSHETRVLVPVAIALAVFLSAVVVLFACLYMGRTKIMRILLRKNAKSQGPPREMIDFVVPSIRVTEVYVTAPTDGKYHPRSSARTKIPVIRYPSLSSLSGDGGLSDTSFATTVSDDDQEYRYLMPSSRHPPARTLSRSHGDLLDSPRTSSSESLAVPVSSEDFSRRYTMERFDIRPNELNTSQYTQSETALDSSAQHSSCEHGKICFSLAYNRRTEVLTVVIRKVVNLSPRPTRLFADPYVKLTLLPDKTIKYVTNVHQRTLDPVFCQTFLFPVKQEEFASKSLKLTVCDHLKFFRQNVLGYTVYPLKELGYPVLSPTHHEIWRALTEDLPFKGSSDSQGEILIGIKLEQDRHLFTLSVLEARDLILSGEEKTHGGVKVKTTIMIGQQVIKCKRTKQRKHPHGDRLVLNKEIKAQVPGDCINKLNVCVSVFADHTFSRSRLVGRSYIGPYSYASGSGLRHWINMLASPSKQNIMWHKLT